MLDQQSGEQTGAHGRNGRYGHVTTGCYGANRPTGGDIARDSGGASRFFYCPKASKHDRGEGNNHPTVKAHNLMRWLCRLVTPPGGLVLDPFAGSGSTALACIAEGFRFLGVEKEPAYHAIAQRRISEALSATPLLKDA